MIKGPEEEPQGLALLGALSEPGTGGIARWAGTRKLPTSSLAPTRPLTLRSAPAAQAHVSPAAGDRGAERCGHPRRRRRRHWPRWRRRRGCGVLRLLGRRLALRLRRGLWLYAGLPQLRRQRALQVGGGSAAVLSRSASCSRPAGACRRKPPPPIACVQRISATAALPAQAQGLCGGGLHPWGRLPVAAPSVSAAASARPLASGCRYQPCGCGPGDAAAPGAAARKQAASRAGCGAGGGGPARGAAAAWGSARARTQQRGQERGGQGRRGQGRREGQRLGRRHCL